MQLARASVHHRVSCSTGAVTFRNVPVRHGIRFIRNICKPVAFKESDRIDDGTTTPGVRGPTVAPGTPTTPSGTTPMYGADPYLSTTGALRPVSLGPVATIMYPALSLASTVSALAATLAPGAVGSFLFRGATMTPTHKVLIFCAGAALIPSIVAKQRIRGAAVSGILAAPSFKQMVSACLLHGVLGLVVLSQAVSLRNPVLAAWVGGLAGLATITSSYTLMKIREGGQLAPSARGMLGGVLSLLTPTNAVATAYSVLTIGLAAAGMALFTSDPSSACFMFLEPKDAVHVFAARIAGAATLGTSVLMFTVKQAAEDRRQGSPAFNAINAGVAMYAGLTTCALGYSLATGLALRSPPTWSFLSLMALTSLFTLYNWATAPK